MPDEPQNQNTEPLTPGGAGQAQNPPLADSSSVENVEVGTKQEVPEIVETPPQAEISELTITEEPKEETQPIESPQEEKLAEEISAPVEAVELPQTEEIKKEQPIVTEIENSTEQEQVAETPPAQIPAEAQVNTPEVVEPILEQITQTPAPGGVGQAPPPQPTPTPPQQPTNQFQPQVTEKVVYKTDPNIIQKLLTKARATIQQRKRAKLDKIMELFNTTPQIANKNVQKLLRTTKRTATRYLEQLEQEQRITQVGKTGKGVLYIKKS